MAGSVPSAVLVHAIPGRARLRIDERTGDEGFFAELVKALVQHPAVHAVRASARTASVLLLHEGELQPILDDAVSQGVLALAQRLPGSPPGAPMQTLLATIDRIDNRIARETKNRFGLGKATIILLASAGIWQTKQGNLLPAGMTLFGYAFGVAQWVAEREPLVRAGDPRISAS